MEKDNQVKHQLPIEKVELSPSVRVEKIGVRHVGALMPVAVQAYIEHYKHLWFDDGRWYLERSFSLSRLQKELSDPNASFYIAYLHDVAAGFLKLNIDAPLQDDADTNELELERIYLTASATGKGVGKELIHFTFRIAAASNKNYVWLKAMDTSTAAISFYKKYGFTQCGTHWLDFPLMKEEYRGMVVFKKTL